MNLSVVLIFSIMILQVCFCSLNFSFFSVARSTANYPLKMAISSLKSLFSKQLSTEWWKRTLLYPLNCIEISRLQNVFKCLCSNFPYFR